MGERDHSKEVVKMVKECEKLYTWAKKFLEQIQKRYDKHAIKHEGMWSLKLGNMCGWTSKILRCPMD